MMAFLIAFVVSQVPGDGYPAGTATPEGVACDMTRAFQRLDSKLFLSTCVKAGAQGKHQEEYGRFLKTVSKRMAEDGKVGKRPDNIPKRILKVYRVRRLSKNGPASAGYAFYNFHDVRFVDIVAELLNGERFSCRTLVVQLEDKSWRAIPRPDLFGLISIGLNDESASTEELPRDGKTE